MTVQYLSTLWTSVTENGTWTVPEAALNTVYSDNTHVQYGIPKSLADELDSGKTVVHNAQLQLQGSKDPAGV